MKNPAEKRNSATLPVVIGDCTFSRPLPAAFGSGSKTGERPMFTDLVAELRFRLPTQTNKRREQPVADAQPETIPANNIINNDSMRSLFPKPVVIPLSILHLKNASLKEKLLLAMCVVDPREKSFRLFRALNIARPGLRKLEQRLIQKKLLTRCEYQRIVYPFPPSTAPAPDTGALVVPPELLEFRYLLCSEKLLLAFYVANPSALNERVVDTLGISLAGLKKLKRGLLNKEVLIATDGGFTVHLPGHVLMRNSEGGHFISESEAVKNGNVVAHAAPRLTPAKVVFDYWSYCLEQMRRKPETTPSYYLSFTSNRIKQIETESPVSAEREAALVVMKQAENIFFARNFWDDILKKCEAKAIAWTRNATPEQLVDFREKVEGMMLAGVPEPKLLAMLTKSISQ